MLILIPIKSKFYFRFCSLTIRLSSVVLKIPAPPEAKLTPFRNTLLGWDRYGGAVDNPNFSAVDKSMKHPRPYMLI